MQANKDLGVSTANRSDNYLFLETAIPAAHFELATRIRPHIAEYMGNFPGLDTTMVTSVSSKMQRCLPGQGYHDFHWEQSTQSPTRAFVWLLYLNDVKQAGETELLNFNFRVPPKEGAMLVFPAAWPWIHRGNPPICEVKYIVTGWCNFNA